MKTKEQYLKEISRIGRIGILITLLLLFAVPVIFGMSHNAMPPLGDFFKAGAGLLVLFVPIGIIEVLSYSPLLGSASYITFITGNIMNLKIPIATNAQELANTSKGSEESDVISTLAVSISAMVTIIMIALGVALLIPLEPIMTSASMQIASKYVLPALFGALTIGLFKQTGKIQVKGKLKAGVVPFILILFINLFMMSTVQYSGILLLFTIPLTIGCAFFLFKKGYITIEIKET